MSYIEQLLLECWSEHWSMGIDGDDPCWLNDYIRWLIVVKNEAL